MLVRVTRSTVAACLLSGLLAMHCSKNRETAPTPNAAASAPQVAATAKPTALGTSTARAAPSDAGSTGDAAAAKPSGALVPSTNHASSFCAIFGTYPDGAKASAESGRDKLLKAGVADVAVRETSEFNELAWGQLVIVSVAKSREDAEAARAKGAAAAKGFVKPCTELTGSFAATAQAVDAIDADTDGCLGWNLAKKSAVCILTSGSLQQGHEATVTFLGATTEPDFTWLKSPGLSFDAKVDPKTVTRLKTAVAKGGYQAFGDYRVRELEPGEEALWAAPKFGIRYERRKQADVVTGQGSWNHVNDALVLDCKNEKTKLFEEELQGVDSQPVRMYWSPKSALLLLRWDAHFALEGDNGGFSKAELYDLSSGCPKALQP